jgi:hypothetical protein
LAPDAVGYCQRAAVILPLAPEPAARRPAEGRTTTQRAMTLQSLDASRTIRGSSVNISLERGNRDQALAQHGIMTRTRRDH